MNPMILKILPYIGAAIFAFGAGWSAAWYVQGLRVTAAKQALVEWQQGMVKAVQAARDHEQTLNVEAQNAWAKNLDELRRTWRTGWVPVVPNGSGAGISLPAPGGTDAACAEPVSAARRIAQDCGETTLQLNQLQMRIEAQKGY